MSPVRIGISGAGGRMGRKLLEVAYHSERSGEVVLAAALEHQHDMLKKDALLFAGQIGASYKPANQILLSDTFDPKSVDVFIDFSTPAAAVELSKKCRTHEIPMIVGVTGFSKAEKEELEAASKDIPLLISPNMSLGMVFMFDIMQRVAYLFKKWDIEICETHHRDKKDTPSGTALRLGEIAAEEIGVSFKDFAVFDRQRQGNERRENEIGFSSIRGGDIIGEHRVIFAGSGEQFEIIHRSTDRINYAFGAIEAAKRIAVKDMPSGLYSMESLFKIPEKNR